MLTEEIERLTEQLEKVRLEQDTLRNQERQIVHRLIAAHKDKRLGSRHTKIPPPSPRGLKKAPHTNQDTKSKAMGAVKSNKKKKGEEEFTVGTRVRILNPKPRNGARYPTEKDKTGTVTRKSTFFIFINRDNPNDEGEVRRARSNLKSI